MGLWKVSGAALGALSQSLACSEGGDKKSTVALLLPLSFQLWVLPLRPEPDHPACSQGVETSRGHGAHRTLNSTRYTRSVRRGESPNTYTAPSHPLGTYCPCSHQEGSEVMGGPEGRGQGQLARQLGGKGLLTEGPRTPRRSSGKLGRGWKLLFPAEWARGLRQSGRLGAKFSRVPSSKCLTFSENYCGSHTRSLGSCSKSSALEAARSGQAGSCPRSADRTAW